jgi:hypothetical protein
MVQGPVDVRITAVAGLAALAAFFGFQLLKSDLEAVFVEDDALASWIQLDRSRPPIRYITRRHGGVFRLEFDTETVRDRALLEFRAVYWATVKLDGKIIYGELREEGDWRRSRSVDLAPFLLPGSHTLEILVEATRAPLLLWAHSEDLSIRTGPGWSASPDLRNWRPALIASDGPKPFDVSREFPHAARALLGRLPYLLPIFLLVVAWNLLPRDSSWPGLKWSVKASQLRWLLIFAWLILAINNAIKVPAYIGMDVGLHMDYVRYLVAHRAIPLATQGGEMMQAPLAYMILAPLYAWLSPMLDDDVVVKALRVLPLACGIAQVEICHRAVRTVYPQREDLQAIGTALGGLMPVNLYLSQSVANEPLAGVTGGIVVLLALRTLMHANEPERTTRLLIGLALGFALLSKVTALLLVPPLLVVLVLVGVERGGSLRRSLGGVCEVLAVAALVAGWYYLRNAVLMGSPFRGTWDAEVGMDWWQEPGYRTADQLLRFGEALAFPVFSAVVGLWDGLYSTLWMDGYLSGMATRKSAPPWNFNFMLSGAWLALLPAGALALGVLRSLLRPTNVEAAQGVDSVNARRSQRFAVACVGLYMLALIGIFVEVPVYCVAKSSYLVAALPCLAVIGAAGFDWLTRNRALRPLVLGMLVCWAFSAYASYFVV